MRDAFFFVGGSSPPGRCPHTELAPSPLSLLPPLPLSAPLTPVYPLPPPPARALVARDVCLVDENPTRSVPAS